MRQAIPFLEYDALECLQINEGAMWEMRSEDDKALMIATAHFDNLIQMDLWVTSAIVPLHWGEFYLSIEPNVIRCHGPGWMPALAGVMRTASSSPQGFPSPPGVSMEPSPRDV